MIQKVFKSSRSHVLLFAALMLSGFVLTGCGSGGGGGGSSDSYDEPVTTQTATPLIEAATLKAWMDDGLINDSGYENVIVLQIGSLADYSAGHIPGAGLWDSGTELNTAGREDGLALDSRLVVDGPTLDGMLQRNGVNSNSTIVISSNVGLNFYYQARAYFMLRYWGFAKEKIKILNGGNAGWVAAGTDNSWDAEYALTTEVTAIAATDFSVNENLYLNDHLRASIAETIQAVDANVEGPQAYNIIYTTTSPASLVLSTSIGRYFKWWATDSNDNGLFDDGTYFLSPAEAREVLLTSESPVDGVDMGDFVEGLPTIVHCVSGMSTSPAFFVLDGLLNLDVQLFDGSRNQWDVYRGDELGSDPYINDDWNVNLYGRSISTATVNIASGISDTEDPDYNEYKYIIPMNNALFSLDDTRANQVETEDIEYVEAGSGSAPTAGSSDDGGDC